MILIIMYTVHNPPPKKKKKNQTGTDEYWEFRKVTMALFLGTQMNSDYAWWSECIPKSSSLILSHLSLFSLANTMPLVPRRIIGLHCRRQTIYWHFASLNSTVSLPGTIHFKQYMF